MDKNKERQLMELATSKDKLSGRKVKAKIMEILMPEKAEDFVYKSSVPLNPPKTLSKFSIKRYIS